ncbi:MAG: DedA family protein [Nitrososphaerota archaeon]|nr:DedA family protein [Nitrososphaerota archaeon]
MSLSQQIFNFTVSLVDKSGYAGIFALMVMESATLPVPSEVVLPLAGFLVYQGHMDFWIAVTVASVGSIIGTLTDYSIGYYLGRAAIIRYGRIVRLNEGHLATSERWFAKYGNITVLLARFVPLIRTLVAFPAGIAEMKLWKFVAYSAVGIIVWDAFLIYVGFLAGQNSTAIIDTLSRIFLPLGVIALAISALIIAIWIRRRKRKAS